MHAYGSAEHTGRPGKGASHGRFARGRATRITCEVNTRPRNDGSLRFHARLGFQEVGTQDTEGCKKTVSLLSKPVGA